MACLTCRCVVASAVALLLGAAAPLYASEYIVESRLPAPPGGQYTDVGCSSTTIKSTAPGCTPMIGSRYSANTTSRATFSMIATHTGSREVWITWGKTSYGDTSVQCTWSHEGGTSTTDLDQSQGDNTWHLLGTGTFIAGQTYTVVLTNATLQGTTPRMLSDAVKWVGFCPEIPRVYVHEPVISGDETVTVAGVHPNAEKVSVYADGIRIGECTSLSGNIVVAVNVSPLLAGQRIDCTQTVDGVTGCSFIDGPIVDDCHQIPEVQIAGMLLAGDTTVVVKDVDAAASAVNIYMNGQLIGANDQPGGASIVMVPVAALVDGAQVSARQVVRGLESCLPPPVIIVGQVPTARGGRHGGRRENGFAGNRYHV